METELLYTKSILCFELEHFNYLELALPRDFSTSAYRYGKTDLC